MSDLVPNMQREPTFPHVKYLIHYVDLPSGGRIEGMSREDALAIAAQLGTRAYQALAVYALAGKHRGLLVVSPLLPLR